MKKILITGFTPFGNEKINPSFEAVKKIQKIAGYEIRKLEVETSFTSSFETVKNEIDLFHPDFILLTGQAGGRASITIEKVAINYIDCSLSDNDGNIIQDKKITEDGPDAYFSTLANHEIIEKVKAKNVILKESYSAGCFVCNYLMYQVLNYIKDKKTKAGFIHVPFENCQTLQNKMPSMALSDITNGLTEIIKAL